MKIIVDTSGGDLGCKEVVAGSLEAIKEFNVDIIFVGIEDDINKELIKYTYDKDKVEVINAPEIIENTEEPIVAIRKKKQSSLVVGSKLLVEGKGDGFLSSGSTGALLGCGLFIVKRMKNVDRAGLSIFYPNPNKFTMVMDVGANMDCKPAYLLQFAIMSSIYYSLVLGVDKPKVGLLNVGSEEGKGNNLSKEAFELLKNSDLNFIGNIEARDLPSGKADIIVCDGFSGNIVLKLTEGLVDMLKNLLKDAIMGGTMSKLGGLLIKPSVNKLKKTLDYREHGGAPLLGLSKPVFKAHGSSDALAYKNAIREMKKFIEADTISNIEKAIEINLAEVNNGK